jgi:malonate transporter and related proteins
MLTILATTFPFFALVLCGYFAVRRQMLPQLAIPGMNGFVLYFALPCLLFRFGSSTPLAQLLDPGVFGVYLAAGLLMVGLTMAASLRRGLDWNNSAFGALVAAFPNTGFMGVPLLVALVGPRASAPVIASMVVDLIIITSLCVALSRFGQASGQGSVVALRHALAGMLRNPMPWAILLGALASGLDLQLPGPAARTVGLLADAASPVALFTIGAVLARSHMQASGSTPLADVVPVATAKLLLHPLLMFGIGHAAMAAGAPLSASSLTVLVLLACLPSASNVAMLSERFGADTGRIARIILVSTALSFLTFSGAVALLV